MKKTLLIIATGIFSLNAQVTNGLVAKYSFNNGNATDEVGTNNGTVNGATLVADRFGNSNKAYHFNGDGDNINFGNDVTLKPTNGSISVWIKRDSISTSGSGYSYNPVLLSRAHSGSFSYEGYAIYISTLNSKVVPVTTDTTTFSQTFFSSNVAVQNNQWLHIVLAYDNDSLWLYLNGVLDTKVYKGYTSFFSPIYDIVIGHNSLAIGNNRSFAGSIDDLRIYNRALTINEVDNLFNESDPTTTTGIFDFHETNNIITIYPNPTKEILTLEMIQGSNIDFIITDLQGKVIKKGNVTTQKHDIDVSNLSEGIYIIKSEGLTQKFIKY
jgi:hypothetical protein